jgi:hypothetical protein
MPGIFYHSQFQDLEPELDEFPVAPRLPAQNRRVPWGIVAGAAEDNNGDDEDNEIGNDEEKGQKEWQSLWLQWLGRKQATTSLKKCTSLASPQ